MKRVTFKKGSASGKKRKTTKVRANSRDLSKLVSKDTSRSALRDHSRGGLDFSLNRPDLNSDDIKHSHQNPAKFNKEKDSEFCENCLKDLSHTERALFVEEEVGRIFCSESCIAAYFTSEISRLEKEYFRRVSSSDLNGDEREKLAHLRWMTLQEPDEVWREKTLSGDYRYTLISEFQPENRFIWSVCICLFLRGEPSFLFMAFQTKNAAMVGAYRKGERVDWTRNQNSGSPGHFEDETLNARRQSTVVDGLADAWTEEETQRAQVTQMRRTDDIPQGDFVLYEGCVDETLETPDEVWSLKPPENNPYQVYHFLRFYADESPGIWYVVIARETEDAGQIEILDAFPTRDSSLVERYRKGHQEIGHSEPEVAARVVH
jgi:hypothetical protein